MQTVESILLNAINLKERLKNADTYWAHLPPADKFVPIESLPEHMNLVFRNLINIISSHGLDKVIDNIICAILPDELIAENSEIRTYIKELFVDTFVFHDFGKVNENFQVDRMNNHQFVNCKTHIEPSHGHSELGGLIYLNYHLEKIKGNTQISENGKALAAYIAIVLSHSIFQHHSATLTAPTKKLKDSSVINNWESLSRYFELFGMKKSKFAHACLSNLDPLLESIELSTHQSFSLFTLSKLNFSLLTASDYLATAEYMHQQNYKNLGLIDDQLRKKVIYATRTTKEYNAQAFDLATEETPLSNPAEKNNINLNIVRLNMAAEVIRSIRQNKDNWLYYLEAPTGGGKSNLSFLAIRELLLYNKEINKVFYVFPFTTLITQTHTAIIDTFSLSESEITCLHSKAGFQVNQEDDTYGSKRLNYINNQFIHYPFCLLTHIRFFDILKTNEKESNYGFHRLANSIVVIDEVQSYPPDQWDKIIYFIKNYAQLLNIRFILMSATLPRIDKLNLGHQNQYSFTDLLPDPRKYFINPNFSQRVSFRFDYLREKIKMNVLADLVLEKSESCRIEKQQKGIFTLVEFIFKSSTTKFLETINNRYFDEVFILSGTILSARRKEIINFIKKKTNSDNKILVITTQVVEAGVDIDMDLGFKNLSIIDSDEQFAGRINRNCLKGICEVYLFQINEAARLYERDYRYKIAREGISQEMHEEILREKNFEKLYNEVLKTIDKLNAYQLVDNFNTDYLPEIAKLSYYNIHHKFKLIEQDTISIFVPLKLPVRILSEKGTLENIFSENDMRFLSLAGVNTTGDTIDGSQVWKIYKQMLRNRASDFVENQINQKILNGILSQFTFSIYYNSSLLQSLTPFITPYEEGNDLSGLENYLYLSHHEQCYDFRTGLNLQQLDDSQNVIL